MARSDTGLAFPGRAAAPEARRDGALTYLPGRRALYLFGGQAQDGLRGDSWLFSLDERVWQSLGPDCSSEPCPAPRSGAAALPLSDGQRVLVFGGRTGVPGEGLRSWIQDLSTGAWTPAEQPTAEAGDLEGGLKRIDYLGKRLERKVGESFDRSALVAEAERGPERSVRWVGQVRVVEGGEYTWRIRSRGGARLFVDGKPVALVGGQANALGRCSRLDAETREIPLASGWHDLVVDWTICRQGGQIEVEVVRGPDGPGPIPPERLRYRSAGGLVRKGYFPMFWWLAETGEDFDRTPADDDWGAGLPEVLGVRWPNHFAVGWEGFVRVEVAGEYRFVAETDDGARLRVGGQRLIDDLWGRAAVRRSAPVWLDAGWHALEFLVVERGGSARARLRFDESCPELGGRVLPAERCAVRFEPAER